MSRCLFLSLDLLGCYGSITGSKTEAIQKWLTTSQGQKSYHSLEMPWNGLIKLVRRYLYSSSVFQSQNFILDVLFSTVRKYADKYKTTYRLWAGPIPSVNIITAEDVEVSFIKHVKNK